ncbi:MAG: class I SAM-dependent methyltransferase [Hamadaea sp.]|uniref:class I SAM-dependent methyltransferase n=1 Tax=Hamadaea sp. TaxID=2024425 RepID=UPI0017E66B67|nr:class I SAM-dependent methyltransferase [Hamadaea sp.]NUT19839.1 class I SAM-dependent methyltransferase [Hamadaea sp.]
MGDSYAVTAEFYDLLQADEFRRLAERLIRRWLGTPEVGVLDVGAGTGLATALLAEQAGVVVHAVEPAGAMRAVLLSRLAGQPHLLNRVRVHAVGVQHVGLKAVADFAWCVNTMACLDPLERAEGLAAMRAALVLGGRLVVQRPPHRLEPPWELPSRRLGDDLYTGQVTCADAGPGKALWRFVYRVTRDDHVVREARESFEVHLAEPWAFADELRAAGFDPIAQDEKEIVVALARR